MIFNTPLDKLKSFKSATDEDSGFFYFLVIINRRL